MGDVCGSGQTGLRHRGRGVRSEGERADAQAGLALFVIGQGLQATQRIGFDRIVFRAPLALFLKQFRFCSLCEHFMFSKHIVSTGQSIPSAQCASMLNSIETLLYTKPLRELCLNNVFCINFHIG